MQIVFLWEQTPQGGSAAMSKIPFQFICSLECAFDMKKAHGDRLNLLGLNEIDEIMRTFSNAFSWMKKHWFLEKKTLKVYSQGPN